MKNSILSLLFCLLFNVNSYALNNTNVDYKISWCSAEMPFQVDNNYSELKTILARRSTVILPDKILVNACQPGNSNIWWFDAMSFQNFSLTKLQEHISNGGVFIVEDAGEGRLRGDISKLNNYSIGLTWENPAKNGMFYRSFYLLQTLDGCPTDNTRVLMLRKKINAQAPVGLLIKAHFLSSGEDCFKDNQDYKIRSFVNIMFAFMTTDYKEDQKELPEILNRIRNLGLEP